MQPPLKPDSSFRNSVVSNKQIRIFCQVHQAGTLSICISAKRDGLAANLDTPRQGWDRSMNDPSGVSRKMFTTKGRRGSPASSHVVRLQFVAAVLVGNQ